MSSKTSHSLDIKLRSFRYRIKSNPTDTSIASNTIDYSEDDRKTPLFFDVRTNPHKTIQSKYNSKTSNKHRAFYLKIQDDLRSYRTIDTKIQTARTFQTFMEKQIKQQWKNKPRVRLPLILSNPQMSFVPVGVQWAFLQLQLQSCLRDSKDINSQIASLRSQLNILEKRKDELDPFVDEFISKCQSLRKGISQNRLKHLQNMTVVRDKIIQSKQWFSNLEDEIQKTIKQTEKIQKLIFDATFQVQIAAELQEEH